MPRSLTSDRAIAPNGTSDRGVQLAPPAGRLAETLFRDDLELPFAGLTMGRWRHHPPYRRAEYHYIVVIGLTIECIHGIWIRRGCGILAKAGATRPRSWASDSEAARCPGTEARRGEILKEWRRAQPLKLACSGLYRVSLGGCVGSGR